ncbi:MAG: DUF2603 domain-containing protein [Sulfuricurvum sp.]|uniref:DUF2603 domain-containing protein n=1 Tax=Sulfuricurvum sp. TaxID=2025608 RepID=UPI002607AAF4|nr:DUF2603 domain-containing protein [Sulfuricurvum sp.]MDD2950563.1 DUF2603 domain-containing protein [Sulfuricurvum sp.]MDD5117648.1 DUF2603 domain-containing protein [Sulfuricurvum sp.]
MSYPEHLNNHLGEVAEKLGIDPIDMTIVKMTPGVDDRHKELELIQGSWKETRPWIIIDEKDRIYTLTSAESLSMIIRLLSNSQSENFQHKLEKAIWQRLPIDFEDVWSVAMDRIQTMARSQSDSTVVNIDLDWLVSEIKQKYPNLFYHLDQIMTQKE